MRKKYIMLQDILYNVILFPTIPSETFVQDYFCITSGIEELNRNKTAQDSVLSAVFVL